MFFVFIFVGVAVGGDNFPKCYFNQSVDYGLLPLTVHFYNNRALFATSNWDFDDDSVSTKKKSHTYFRRSMQLLCGINSCK